MLFEGVNNQGQYVSIDLGYSNIKDTQAVKEDIISNPIDRFFLIKNRNIGTTTKKQVLIYLNFQGEIGLYNFETQYAMSFKFPEDPEIISTA